MQGVAYAVEGLVHTAQNSSDDQGILNNVSGSAEEAQKALDELIRFIKQTPLSTQQDGKPPGVKFQMQFAIIIISASNGFSVVLPA